MNVIASTNVRNQVRVIIRMATLKKRTPWKILLPKPLRWALEESCKGTGEYTKTDQGHYFNGLLIVVDPYVQEPIVVIKPEPRAEPLQLAPKGSKYANAYL